MHQSGRPLTAASMRLLPQSGTQLTRLISSSARSRNLRMVDLDEPLVHGAEDDGRLAAPAMRIAVMVILLVQQRLADAQFVQHGFVRLALAVLFQDGLAEHLGRHLLLFRQVAGESEPPVIVHRRIDGQAVLAAEVVVVQPVARGDVDEAGAGGIVHEAVAGEELPGAVAEGMLVFDLAQVPAVEAADDLIILPAALLGHRRQQQGGDDVLLLARPARASS